MQRIMIVGPANSGKSSLAQALAVRLALPVHHLDQHYWQPGWEPKSADEWRQAHQKLIAKRSWIIDGDFAELFLERASRADTIIYLAPPRRLLLPRALNRYRKYRGSARPGMIPQNHEKLRLDTLRDILSYDRKTMRAWMDELCVEKEVYILASQTDVKKFLGTF